MINPLVEMDGDEMTRIIWQKIKDLLINPYVNLKSEYYDLGLPERERTSDAVTIEAAKATARLGVAVKCATITPNPQRVEEYNLSNLWRSPNATLRAHLDGTVFRKPITSDVLLPWVRSWKRPITIARHASGDVYQNVEYRVDRPAKVELLVTSVDGSEQRVSVDTFADGDNGIVQVVCNRDASIANFARACFNYALGAGEDLWFSAKDTISRTYDQRFKEIFAELYEREYRDAFAEQGIEYHYTLIDDMVARVIKSEGGFIWACKNYDGDVMSDMLASANGSLAMMTSVLVSPSGVREYEAAHGTVTRHYYRHLKGEKTSTNPMATLFAWTGALAWRAHLDDIPELAEFAKALEDASLRTISAGIITGDLRSQYIGENCQTVTTDEFLVAIADRFERG